MGVLVVQHVPGEGPYAIREALTAAGLSVEVCRVWAGDGLPQSLQGHEALVVTGGPMGAARDDGFPTRDAELRLLREALAAEVPLLGVCLGARLLAVAAGGVARAGTGVQADRSEVLLTPWAGHDLLFRGMAGRWGASHCHGDGVELPDGAVSLAARARYPAQAFRVGGAAWGLQFHPEAEGTSAPSRDRVFGRFAALVAARAPHTATRTFFTPRADAWETRFAADGPRYAEAVARMGLRPGRTVLDLGCGSGRALPALRMAVGAAGTVLGLDVTSAMLVAAAREGRRGPASLLAADCMRLPLPPGAVHGIFTAGLLDHLPDPGAALHEWARVTAPDGVLLLFHPSGRVERAARHGRPLTPDDPLAEPNLRPMLDASGFELVRYEDAREHFLARAVRAR
ncbi:methyltransferase domain-containing protein [Streptomyces sp. NPDC059446]|uniref:methyltransferase domain-containing protein n=1 Tax=Streptomyces sp. NPDC059446 TaxID=3346833 RepID=UPI00369CE495